MDTNNVVKKQISDQQLPSVSSQTFHEPCSVHKRRTNNEEKALATYKNKQYVRKVGGEAKTISSLKVLYQHKPYVDVLVFLRKWFEPRSNIP